MNSNYDALAGGVNAFGGPGRDLGRLGRLGVLGGVQFPNAVGFTINGDGYLVRNSDGSLWVYCLDNDGVYGLDPTTGYYLIQAA